MTIDERSLRVIHLTSGCTAMRSVAGAETSSSRQLCEECVTRRIVRTCVAARLPRHDAEDLAQDIWLWLLRTGPPEQFTNAWLQAVTRNFLLRYWRQSVRALSRHEELTERELPVPDASETERLELALSLDRIAGTLPPREQRLLGLLRKGHSFSDAADLAGVPKGSRHFCRSRLLESVQRGLVPAR